jgi:hypothetical protein
MTMSAKVSTRPGKGQHPDDDADDAQGGADLQAVFRPGSGGIDESLQPG